MYEEKNKTLVDVATEIITRCHEAYLDGGPVALDELLRNHEPNSASTYVNICFLRSTYRFKSELTEWEKFLELSIGAAVRRGDDMKSFRGLRK